MACGQIGKEILVLLIGLDFVVVVVVDTYVTNCLLLLWFMLFTFTIVRR